MSRDTVYKDERFALVAGRDHVLGLFVQLFDKKMEDETPEGEGLVLDCSQLFGVERNLTGIPIPKEVDFRPIDIAMQYIENCKAEEKEE